MGRYFGTDGIRGKANVALDVNRAFLVGQCLGHLFSRNRRGKILVGKDTRQSSGMFEHAIAAGASSCGADVYLMSTCPTPAVAFLTKEKEFDCGVMISASHNPFYDNGIKVFSSQGTKLDPKTESQIEDYIDGKSEIELCTEDQIGEIIGYNEGLEHYLTWMGNIFPLDLSGFRIAVDCANGSASVTAQRLLERLGADCTVICDKPNGININTDCGSTHPERLQQLVKEGNFDLGLAFDGDADRLIATDSNGHLLDGDFILYICGQHMKRKNELNGNTIVTTVMANLGFFKAMERVKINTISTQVGDKYVYECMVKEDYVLGGEQSGHIIFKEHSTTGDGLLTACKLLEVMKETKKTAIELSEGLDIYPQLLVNVKVQDKQKVMESPLIKQAIEEAEKQLDGNGRILVRPSGTEPLVRVMVEAKTDEICQQMVQKIVDRIH